MLLHLLIFRAVPGPHPCLPPAGEGEKARGIGEFTLTLTLSRKREREKNSLSHLWERAGVRVGANLAFAAAPAHIQGRARPPSLPSPRGGRREDQREEAVPSP